MIRCFFIWAICVATASAIEWRGPTPIIIWQQGSALAAGGMNEETIDKLRSSGMNDETVAGIVDGAKVVSVSEAYVVDLEKKGGDKKLLDVLRKKLSVEYKIETGQAAVRMMQERGGVTWLGDSQGAGYSLFPFEAINGKQTGLFLSTWDTGHPTRAMSLIIADPLEDRLIERNFPLINPPIDADGRSEWKRSYNGDRNVILIDKAEYQLSGYIIDAKGVKHLLLVGYDSQSKAIDSSRLITVTSGGVLGKISLVGCSLNEGSAIIGLDPGLIMIVNPENDNEKARSPTIFPCSLVDGVISPLTKNPTRILVPEGLAASGKTAGMWYSDRRNSGIAVTDVDSDGKNELIICYQSEDTTGEQPVNIFLYYVIRGDGSIGLILGSQNTRYIAVSGVIGLFLVDRQFERRDKGPTVFSVNRK